MEFPILVKLHLFMLNQSPDTFCIHNDPISSISNLKYLIHLINNKGPILVNKHTSYLQANSIQPPYIANRYSLYSYDSINFLQNTRNRHPIAWHKGKIWGVFCVFESMIQVTQLQFLCCILWDVIIHPHPRCLLFALWGPSQYKDVILPGEGSPC